MNHSQQYIMLLVIKTEDIGKQHKKEETNKSNKEEKKKRKNPTTATSNDNEKKISTAKTMLTLVKKIIFHLKIC